MRYLSENQFDVFEEIGKGGFGVVYRGFDKVTKTDVAIKQIDLEKTDDLDDLQREIKILSQCKSEHITEYHGCFVKGYKLWIIMEYLDAGSCHDLLASGPLKEKYVSILLKELLVSLNYLHQNSRIHRDVKAANILLNSNGDVKIADFGVSAQLSNNLSRRNTFVGSPYWMSPEVILEKEYNFKADIWSLGITAIELVTGKPPLSHIPPMKALFQIPELEAPTLIGDDYSSDLKEFISMCLRKDPVNRPTAKRLLQTKFILKAGRKSSLVHLIERKQKWDANHKRDGKIKSKKLYVPTVEHKNDVNFSFDFEDSFAKESESSEVVITKLTPLRYVSSDTVNHPLKENENILNRHSNQPKDTESSFLENTSGPSDKSSLHANSDSLPSKLEDFIANFVQKTHSQDSGQSESLIRAAKLLSRLDHKTLCDFSNALHDTLKDKEDFEKSSESQYSLKSSRSMVEHNNTKEFPKPRKTESEKLLLKRWADQYFN